MSLAPKCSYCDKTSVVWLRWPNVNAENGQRKGLMFTHGACEKHITSDDFRRVMTEQPHAAVIDWGKDGISR